MDAMIQGAPLATIALRGWLLVSAVAFNVSQVAAGHYVIAFLSGTLVSVIWWGNAGRAHSGGGWRAAMAYGLGAGCGTVTGMWVGSWI